MSREDLVYVLARRISSAIPSATAEQAIRAARAVIPDFDAEWQKGYRYGKESGLMDSAQAGEIAGLRERLKRAQTQIETLRGGAA